MERGGEGKNRCWPGRGGVNSGRFAINHLFVQSMARDTKVSLVSSNKCAKRFYIRNATRRSDPGGGEPRSSKDFATWSITTLGLPGPWTVYTLFKRVSKGVGAETEIDSASSEIAFREKKVVRVIFSDNRHARSFESILFSRGTGIEIEKVSERDRKPVLSSDGKNEKFHLLKRFSLLLRSKKNNTNGSSS